MLYKTISSQGIKYGNSNAAYFPWGIGIIVSSVLFGLAHMYQGVVGVIEAFVFGVVATGLYLASKRNLWPSILFHGMNDAIGVLLIFFGLYP